MVLMALVRKLKKISTLAQTRQLLIMFCCLQVGKMPVCCCEAPVRRAGPTELSSLQIMC